MNKLNFLGAGPRIGLVALPWLAGSIFLSIKFPDTFAFVSEESRILNIAGLILVITGIVMYFATVPFLLKGIKEGRLVRSGAFRVCRNPLYASIILFMIPGISLMMNSWLVMITSIIAYIAFKILIRSEYAEMEKFFGDDYRRYCAETPEFFPFSSIKRNSNL